MAVTKRRNAECGNFFAEMRKFFFQKFTKKKRKFFSGKLFAEMRKLFLRKKISGNFFAEMRKNLNFNKMNALFN